MSTLGMVQLLYAALALVMAGLGLSLRVQALRELRGKSLAVGIALVLQMAVMPCVAYFIVKLFQLPAPLAIGMLILAATPGSISANLYSHLFGGNVAFNIALTGLNTFLCALTLPLIGTWALDIYAVGPGKHVPILLDNVAQTIGIVLLPTLAGMAIAAKSPAVALRLAKPVKVVSAAVVVIFSVAAITKEWDALVNGLAGVGSAVLLLNVVGVALSYSVAKAVSLKQTDAVTITFQVSVHNAIQAIYVALAILGDPLIALPAAVYSITMNVFALGFGLSLGTHGRWGLSREARCERT